MCCRVIVINHSNIADLYKSKHGGDVLARMETLKHDHDRNGLYNHY